MVNLDALTDAVMAAFGEPCIVTVQGTDTVVTGVFTALRPSRELGGVMVQPQEPLLRLRTRDLPQVGLVDAAVQVRGRIFRVGRALPDNEGLTDLELQEVFP